VIDAASLKGELSLFDKQLAVMSGREKALQEELEQLKTRATQVEGAAMYVRGKLVELGEAEIDSTAGGTLPDLTTLA